MTTIPNDVIPARLIGRPHNRLDGPAKVAGGARYAFEHHPPGATYLHLVPATVARGRIAAIHVADALATPGVVTVLTHHNAPRVNREHDPELAILQGDEVAYRGQLVTAVVAESPEAARQGAEQVRVDYEQAPHDVTLPCDGHDLDTPEHINPFYPTDTAQGDVADGIAGAAVTVGHTYSTPMQFNNPMEPHTSVAVWEQGDQVTIHESTQGVHGIANDVAAMFELPTEQVRALSPHVGGGFGAKAFTHPPVIVAVMAAKLVGRPVKLALTRHDMFTQVGYRTPTIQRIQLGADSDGRLTAIAHDVVEQTARFKVFAEQTAIATRMMYAAPNRRTSHRLAALDVGVPTIMRAPGETPGMYGLEVAMDELAEACGLDPVQLRIRNEPDVHPESGKPFSTRNLVACLQEGARRFGWYDRDPSPGARMERGWLMGTGVASSTYPVNPAGMPSRAVIRVLPDGRYEVGIGGADIGTGTWTALSQVAADALEVDLADIELRIGDSEQPIAPSAGGSRGLASWGSAVVDAARRLREQYGISPDAGTEVTGELQDNPAAERFSMHSYGAHFVEAWVHADTGEIRVPRMLGVFALGRMINPKTGRSQLLGGMTMGLSMALHEAGVVDPRHGHVVNHDFAEYHIATSADVGTVDVHWLDEHDPYVNPMGSKGIGELGIVGAAAAVVNAAYHATGIRVRDLPLTPEKFLS